MSNKDDANDYDNDDLSLIPQHIIDAQDLKDLREADICGCKEVRHYQKIIAQFGIGDIKTFIQANKLDFDFEGAVDNDNSFMTIYTDVSIRYPIVTVIVKTTDYFR